MQIDTRLLDWDVQVLRELNGENTGAVGGAGMLVAASFLKSLGYATGLYTITQKGKDYLAFLDQKDTKNDGA